MVVTSTCVNSKVLSMLRSLTICCNEPPKVIVDPTATFGPSGEIVNNRSSESK